MRVLLIQTQPNCLYWGSEAGRDAFHHSLNASLSSEVWSCDAGWSVKVGVGVREVVKTVHSAAWLLNPPSWSGLSVAPQLLQKSLQQWGGKATTSRLTSLSCRMTFRYYGECIPPRSSIKRPSLFSCMHPLLAASAKVFTAHKRHFIL